MAFDRNRKSARLTGLFAMKNRRGYTGSMRPEDLPALIEVIKEAKAAGKGVVFFVWRNEPGKGPSLTLSAAVSQDYRGRDQDGSARRRPIGGYQQANRRPAPPAEDEPLPDRDDSLFGDDDAA